MRLLSNLETDQHKLLQIVMAGQPELDHRLASAELRQLRQRIQIRYHLPALTEAETAGYIAHRLSVAGGDGSVIFSDKAIEIIYKYAKGIPRMINAACDNALLAAYVAGSRQIEATCVKRAIQHLEGKS